MKKSSTAMVYRSSTGPSIQNDAITLSDVHELAFQSEHDVSESFGSSANSKYNELSQDDVDQSLRIARSTVVLIDSLLQGADLIASGKEQDQVQSQVYLYQHVYVISFNAFRLFQLLKKGLMQKYLVVHPECCSQTVAGVTAGSGHELVFKLALDIVTECWNIVFFGETGERIAPLTVLECPAPVAMIKRPGENKPIFKAEYVNSIVQVLSGYGQIDQGLVNSWLNWEAAKIIALLPGRAPEEFSEAKKSCGNDGPAEIRRWRHKGRISHKQLERKKFSLARFLHEHLDRKFRLSDFTFDGELFEGKQQDTVRRAGNYIWEWFASENMPISVHTENGLIWMEVSTSKERKEILPIIP